jgi:hypothetical protein
MQDPTEKHVSDMGVLDKYNYYYYYDVMFLSDFMLICAPAVTVR